MSLFKNEHYWNDYSARKICTLCQNVINNDVLIKLDDCGCRFCSKCLSEYLKDNSRLFNWKCKQCGKEVTKACRVEKLSQCTQESRDRQELDDS